MDLCKPLLFPSCGSRRYAPPEILFADDAINIDAKKADIWSLYVSTLIITMKPIPLVHHWNVQDSYNYTDLENSMV